MAETSSLLRNHTSIGVSRVRIPPSPPFPIVLYGLFVEMGDGYQNRSLRDLSVAQPYTVRSAHRIDTPPPFENLTGCTLPQGHPPYGSDGTRASPYIQSCAVDEAGLVGASISVASRRPDQSHLLFAERYDEGSLGTNRLSCECHLPACSNSTRCVSVVRLRSARLSIMIENERRRVCYEKDRTVAICDEWRVGIGVIGRCVRR